MTTKCATKGCGHPRDKHVIDGHTCWGDGTTCPCSAYSIDAAETKAREAARTASNEPIPGGPTIASEVTAKK